MKPKSSIFLSNLLVIAAAALAAPHQHHLQQQQHELIKSNPGSLQAVARAFKMAIQECKYQMRDEPWNCTISTANVSSIKPTEIFGSLMSRSFKETSFIQSLISSAIAHSITRACTESTIRTCNKRNSPHGNGFSEDIEFGREFAKRFMELNHELPSANSYDYNYHSKAAQSPLNSIQSNSNLEQQNLIHIAISTSGGLSSNSIDHQPQQPIWKERKLRHMINAHNDEVGRLRVLDGMRRECKCHGLSGTCTMQTCWLRLPPFREVANRLHDSLEQALRVEMYAAQNSHYGPIGGPAAGRYKSLTSMSSSKKSNKKRSSSSAIQSASMLNGFGRTPVSSLATKSTHSMMGGFGVEGGANPTNGVGSGTSRLHALNNFNNVNSTVVKKRPVARSIGIAAATIAPGKFDLLYAEESPDFCVPSERYNIKGTRGRQCSENKEANNSCEKLCCGRGYRTEIREEKYKCECKFQFCCKLDCNICTRRKTLYKCL